MLNCSLKSFIKPNNIDPSRQSENKRTAEKNVSSRIAKILARGFIAIKKLNHSTIKTHTVCREDNMRGCSGTEHLKACALKNGKEALKKDGAIDRFNQYAKDVRCHYDKPGTRIPKHECHSILHTSRAALYGMAAINLYRVFTQDFVMSNDLISEQEFIDYSQVAILLHDSGREGDGIDYWDKESGENVYHYLTKQLDVDPDKAIIFAEAVANKDFKNTKEKKNSFYCLEVDANGQCSWLKSMFYNSPRDTLQSNLMSIIQFGDCLDIIRARDHFDPLYLSFVQEVGHDNPGANAAVKQLISEARYLIEKQGMGRFSANKLVQQEWMSTDDIYLRTLQYVQDPEHHFVMLPALINDGKLLSDERSSSFDVVSVLNRKYQNLSTEDKALNRRKDKGKLWSRMIYHPSKINDKKKNNESNANVEIRKAYRAPGVKTRGGCFDKHGNPDRSVSLMGFGSPAFAPAGFMVDSPQIDDFSSISIKDVDTGYGKKVYLIDNSYTKEQLMDQYDELKEYLLEGKGVYSHNESLLTITKFDGVMYTQDPTCRQAKQAVSPVSPILQALYLQKEHERQTGFKLPIYEYSGLADVIKARTFSEDDIVELWKQAASDYITSCLSAEKDVSDMPVNEIKKRCLSGQAEGFVALDSVFPKELQKTINEVIEESRRKILLEHSRRVLAEIVQNQGQDGVLSDPSLLDPIRARAIAIEPKLSSSQIEAVMRNLESTMKHRGFSSRPEELSCYVDLFERINKPDEKCLTELKKAFLDCLSGPKVAAHRVKQNNAHMEKIFRFLKNNNLIQNCEFVSAMSNGVIKSCLWDVEFDCSFFDLSKRLGLSEEFRKAVVSMYREIQPILVQKLGYSAIMRDPADFVRFLQEAGLMDQAALSMIQKATCGADLYRQKEMYKALSKVGDETLQCRKLIAENLSVNIFKPELKDLDVLIELAKLILASGDALPKSAFERLLENVDLRDRFPYVKDIAYYFKGLIKVNSVVNRLFPESTDSFNDLISKRMKGHLDDLFTNCKASYDCLGLIVSGYIEHANSQLDVNMLIVQKYLERAEGTLLNRSKAEKRRHEKLMIAFSSAYPETNIQKLRSRN